MEDAVGDAKVIEFWNSFGLIQDPLQLLEDFQVIGKTIWNIAMGVEKKEHEELEEFIASNIPRKRRNSQHNFDNYRTKETRFVSKQSNSIDKRQSLPYGKYISVVY